MFNRSTIVAIILAVSAGFATSAMAAHARTAHKHVARSGLHSFAAVPAYPRTNNWRSDSTGDQGAYYPGDY
jgi:hypothetical protein